MMQQPDVQPPATTETKPVYFRKAILHPKTQLSYRGGEGSGPYCALEAAIHVLQGLNFVDNPELPATIERIVEAGVRQDCQVGPRSCDEVYRLVDRFQQTLVLEESVYGSAKLENCYATLCERMVKKSRDEETNPVVVVLTKPPETILVSYHRIFPNTSPTMDCGYPFVIFDSHPRRGFRRVVKKRDATGRRVRERGPELSPGAGFYFFRTLELCCSHLQMLFDVSGLAVGPESPLMLYTGQFVSLRERIQEERSAMIMNSPLVEKLEILAGERVLATVPKCLLKSASQINRLGSVKQYHVTGASFQGFDGDVFCRLLFGDATLLPFRQLFDLYSMFRALGMKKRAFLVCSRVQQKKSIRKIASLLRQAEQHFEKEEEGEVPDVDPWDPGVSGDPVGLTPICSGFALACLNGLAKNKSVLQDDDGLREYLGSLKLLVKVENHSVTPLRTHGEFAFDEDSVPKSWNGVTNETLAQLHRDDSLSDVLVRSALDEAGDAAIPGHLAVLIWKTNFFYNMLHFEVGAEASSIAESASVTVEDLSPEALDALFEFIYLGQISTRSLSVLFPLYAHAHKYQETDLLKCAFLRIKAATRELVEEGEFESGVVSVSSHIQSPTFVRVRRFWTEDIEGMSSGKLAEILDRGERDRRIEAVETRLEEMDVRFRRIENLMEELLKKMNE